MTRFFIDSFDGDSKHVDCDGMDLPSKDDARWQALNVMPDMAREKIPNGDERVFIVIVRNEQGQVLYEATMTLQGQWKEIETLKPALSSTFSIFERGSATSQSRRCPRQQ